MVTPGTVIGTVRPCAGGTLTTRWARRVALVGVAVLAVSTIGAAAASAAVAPDHTLPANTRFYVDPKSEAAQQAASDLKNHDPSGALAMEKLASWPEAIWFTSGTPRQVSTQVHQVVGRASDANTVPVLVAYDIPLRDCGQYSAGGAQSDADYQAWITAFAKAIGNRRAVVLVEPDSLANLPSDCGPTSDPDGSLSAARIADINYAVDVLEAQPRTVVYLDGGHSQWHATGDQAVRLWQAGVARAQGFFLDVSNFEPTAQLEEYGNWVSECIWFATQGPSWAAGQFSWCASQYYSSAAPNDGLPGDAVDPSDPSTWHWTDLWFAQNAGTPPLDQLTHFVVDTSRNGQGHWTPPAGKYTGDPQVWCNPPGRGIGDRPTANTGVPLVDAYLWVKTIGESDGTCTRGTAGPGDPEYGNTVDPAAGAWWPAQAETLVANANPALTFNHR